MIASAGIVADKCEIFRALFDERVDEFVRLARVAEATDHHGGAIRDIGQRCGRRVYNLVDHGREFAFVGFVVARLYETHLAHITALLVVA